MNDLSELREQIIKSTHEWIRDCGLDVQDVEAFVKREVMPLIDQYTAKEIESDNRDITPDKAIAQYREQVDEIIDDLIVGHNFEYAHKEIMKLLAKQSEETKS